MLWKWQKSNTKQEKETVILFQRQNSPLGIIYKYKTSFLKVQGCKNSQCWETPRLHSEWTSLENGKKVMYVSLTCLVKYRRCILCWMFSNVKEKAESAEENAQVTSWHPSATLLSPLQPLSSFIHLNPTWMFG